IFLIIILISLCACSSSSKDEAKDMTLNRFEGEIQVTESAKNISHFAGMNLYSGYALFTETESYSWIMLDGSTLLKMDEKTRTSIETKASHLKIRVEEGNLFFCVPQPLKDHETLEFETTNMTLAIRGTTGLVRAISERLTAVVLLEGEAEITTKEETQTIRTGQRADISSDPEGKVSIALTPIAMGGDVGDFAQSEIDADASIRKKIEDDHGQTDFLSEEDMIAVLSGFTGRWTGPPFAVRNWNYEYPVLDLLMNERGFGFQYSQEYLDHLKAYNDAAAAEEREMIPMSPTPPVSKLDEIRILNDHSLQLLFGTMTLSDDASVLEIVVKNTSEHLTYTRIP
ncbi:MAG: FecR domain-containing protein, partial [Erysipelotrichaceae bacterium]|nr:FecR domain-containing protein [Erysipelotrichaceae bacterium]